MHLVSLNRQIGSIFLIVGVEIGAGILALPILLAKAGIFFGSLILVITWAVMLYTALLLAKINLTLPKESSFAVMSKSYLGSFGKVIVSFVFFLTLSAINMAYISASGSTFGSIFNLPEKVVSLVFVMLFSIVVVWGTRAVDYTNRLFLSAKLVLFLLVTIILLGVSKFSYLFYEGSFRGVVAYFPAIVTSFILHNIIPTIRTYLNSDEKVLKRVIVIGSVIPLMIYILWFIAVIGNIPQKGIFSFSEIFNMEKAANVGHLLAILAQNTQNNLIIILINAVTAISVTTSFLGTSISLYQFLQDFIAIKKKNSCCGYLWPVFFTFLLPLIIVFVFPNIFIRALSFAGFGATMLFVLAPVLMVWRAKVLNQEVEWGILSHNYFLVLTLLFGMAILGIEFFYNLI